MEKKASDYKRQTIMNLICTFLWGIISFLKMGNGEKIGFFYLFLCFFFLSITMVNFKNYRKKLEEKV